MPEHKRTVRLLEEAMADSEAPAVGSIPDQSFVDDAGQFHWRMSIPVPPGRAGMEPLSTSWSSFHETCAHSRPTCL